MTTTDFRLKLNKGVLMTLLGIAATCRAAVLLRECTLVQVDCSSLPEPAITCSNGETTIRISDQQKSATYQCTCENMEQSLIALDATVAEACLQVDEGGYWFRVPCDHTSPVLVTQFDNEYTLDLPLISSADQLSRLRESALGPVTCGVAPSWPATKRRSTTKRQGGTAWKAVNLLDYAAGGVHKTIEKDYHTTEVKWEFHAGDHQVVAVTAVWPKIDCVDGRGLHYAESVAPVDAGCSHKHRKVEVELGAGEYTCIAYCSNGCWFTGSSMCQIDLEPALVEVDGATATITAHSEQLMQVRRVPGAFDQSKVSVEGNSFRVSREEIEACVNKTCPLPSAGCTCVAGPTGADCSHTPSSSKSCSYCMIWPNMSFECFSMDWDGEWTNIGLVANGTALLNTADREGTTETKSGHQLTAFESVMVALLTIVGAAALAVGIWLIVKCCRDPARALRRQLRQQQKQQELQELRKQLADTPSTPRPAHSRVPSYNDLAQQAEV